MGQTFFETDDIDFDDFPQLTFFDGVPDFLDYLVFDGFPTDIIEPGVDGFGISDALVFDPADGVYKTTVQVFTPVPEPTSPLSLLVLGTIGAASTLKRKLKHSKYSEKETEKLS